MPEQQLQGTSGVVHEKSPRVSIGMPVYNGEKYIRETLDSLLVQTFTDFELIISDNGSTDGTEAICRVYAERDSRIRYVRQRENRGMMFNYLFVLDEARGEFFMWASHDDIWSTNWLETMVQNAGAGVIAFGRMVDIHPDGTVYYEAPLMHCSQNLQLRSIQIVLNSKRRNHLILGLFYAPYLKKEFRERLEWMIKTFPDETYHLLAMVQDNYVICDERATFYKREGRPLEKKIKGYDLFINRLYIYIVLPLKRIPNYILYLAVPTSISVRLLIILSFPVFLAKWLMETISLYYKGALRLGGKLLNVSQR